MILRRTDRPPDGKPFFRYRLQPGQPDKLAVRIISDGERVYIIKKPLLVIRKRRQDQSIELHLRRLGIHCWEANLKACSEALALRFVQIWRDIALKPEEDLPEELRPFKWRLLKLVEKVMVFQGDPDEDEEDDIRAGDLAVKSGRSVDWSVVKAKYFDSLSRLTPAAARRAGPRRSPARRSPG